MYTVSLWPEEEEILKLGEVKARRRPREYMSKDALAGEVWEVDCYCLISLRLTKRSLHMMAFSLIPRS